MQHFQGKNTQRVNIEKCISSWIPTEQLVPIV